MSSLFKPVEIEVFVSVAAQNVGLENSSLLPPTPHPPLSHTHIIDTNTEIRGHISIGFRIYSPGPFFKYFLLKQRRLKAGWERTFQWAGLKKLLHSSGKSH